MKRFTLIVTIVITINTSGFSQWIFQNSGISTNLYSIYFLDEKNGWVTGASGTILKTENGGENWQAIPSGTNFSLSFVKFFNQNKGIVAGSGGTIKKSDDGGDTWYDVPSGTNLRFQEGSFINENVGWIVGDNGIVVKTTDGGDTWTTQAFVTSDNLSFVQFIDENTGWVTSENNGEIWKTTDGGNSWQYKYETQADINLWQIHFVTQNIGWAVAEFGVVIKSTDGGDSWFIQNTGTNSVNLRSVYFHDTQNGWVVGKDEYILRTTNGGNIWILDRSGPGFELLHVFFLDGNLGWAIGTAGTVLYTDNWGGFPFQTSPISVLVPNGGEILTAGSTYFIEWNSQNVVNVKIEYSTNNGTNWISVIDSIPSTGIYDWTVPDTFTTEGRVKISDLTDPNIFDISDQSFTIQSSKVITVISPNGGEILDGGNQFEILWSSEDVEYVKLEHSINNGASWNSITDSTESTGVYLWTVPNILTTQARIKISDISLPSIYDASDESFRINYVVSVDENVIATVYKLHQNFPNPFNPTTTIKYQIPELSIVTIKIYDILGNELASLINEEKPAGNFEVEFNATALSSGIYYYKLVAGDFVDVKKMILLK